jgi:hypothetical protein
MYYLPEALVIHSNRVDKEGNNAFYQFQKLRQSISADKMSFTVPEGIERLMIFDDYLATYVKQKDELKIYEINGPYKLFLLPIMPETKINFDYHSISIE